MTKLDDTLSDAKTKINKSTFRKVVVGYPDIQIEVLRVLKTDYTKEDLMVLLKSFRNFCAKITVCNCRKLWSSATENDLDGIEGCKVCCIYKFCSQNTDNHHDNSAYYLLCLLWKELIAISDYGAEMDRNKIDDIKNKLDIIQDQIEDAVTEVDNF